MTYISHTFCMPQPHASTNLQQSMFSLESFETLYILYIQYLKYTPTYNPDSLFGWLLIMLVFSWLRTWFSFQVSEGVEGWQQGGGEHLKDLQKNERSTRRRSQTAITTACCSDGGDNVRSGANRKLALWTSAHPVFLHLQPKAAEQKSLTSFKGVSQRSGKGCVQEGAGKCTTQSELHIL